MNLYNRHVQVSLKVMEKLLSEVNSRQLQLLAGSYLDMLHEMLQSSDHDIQIMAAHSVSSFALVSNRLFVYKSIYSKVIGRLCKLYSCVVVGGGRVLALEVEEQYTVYHAIRKGVCILLARNLVVCICLRL